MQQTIFEDWTITSKGSAAPRRVNRKEHSLIFSLTAAKFIIGAGDTCSLTARYMFDSKEINNISCRKEQRKGRLILEVAQTLRL